MKLQATLSIAFPTSGGVSIRLRDNASRLEFVDLAISHEEFTRALSTLQERPLMECEVRGLQHIGKTNVTERRSIECPLRSHDREVLCTWLKENAQEEGWILNTYLGSQTSVSYNNDKTILNYSVTKYVEQA